MATIHVKAKFHFTPPTGGDTVVYAIGTHTGVPKATAEHPFVKAHCTDLPPDEGDKDNGAALALLNERDVQIGDLAAQLASASARINALCSDVEDAKSHIDALTTERDALVNQVTELQAGGTASKKKT